MDSSPQAIGSRAEIVKSYKIAIYCYAAPFVSLLLGVVHFVFFPLFLLSLFPLGIAGMYFTKRGLSIAIKSGDIQKKDVGYANVTLGIIILVLGLLGLAFVFVMTS